MEEKWKELKALIDSCDKSGVTGRRVAELKEKAEELDKLINESEKQ